MANELIQCNEQGCHFRTDNGVEANLHDFGHHVDKGLTNLQGQINEVREGLAPLASLEKSLQALPATIGQHFHQAMEQYNPTHAHFQEVVENTDTCPSCKAFRDDYDLKLIEATMEKLKAETPDPAPAAVSEPPAAPPAPVYKPRVFEDFDPIGHRAYGLDYEETEDGRYLFTVEDEDLAKEAIETGVLPASCKVSVGPDGKTVYICEEDAA